MTVEGFTTLALYDTPGRPTGLRHAAESAGLAVLDVPEDPSDLELPPRPGLAWRCPAGLVARQQAAGHEMPLTGAPASWIADLPYERLGRHLVALPASALVHGPDPELRSTASIKLATHELRSQPLQRVTTWQQCRAWAAQLPADPSVLVADRWLELHSEYRVFTVGRRVVACSPYLVEGEPWSVLLPQHRASFHDEAADAVRQVLAELPDDQVPPAVVLDVGRLEADGQLVVLEVNTTWGAGLYGCDPHAVLEAVLAANAPAAPCWTWRP